jgi:hypothetical protein
LVVFLIPVLLLIAHTVSAATIANVPESGVLESEEGKAVIEWSPTEASPPSDLEYQLQQSTRVDFGDAKTLYEGPDLGTVVTGLAEGDYFYRVREILGPGSAGEWSAPLTVRVVYPGRGFVSLLMGLGLVVFIATVAAIAIGHTRASHERPAS